MTYGAPLIVMTWSTAFLPGTERAKRSLTIATPAPDRYADTEEPEEARGHLRAAQHSRLIAQSDGDVDGVVAFETTETIGARSPIAERGIGRRAPLIGTHA